MKSETTTKIILDARRLVDGETSNVTTDLEPDTELLAYMNDAYEEFLDLVVDSGGTDLIATFVDLASPYTLTGVYRTLALSKNRGDGNYVDLRRFNFHERNKYTSTDFPAWRVMDNTVRLYPGDATPGTLRLWYIPDADTFTAGESVPVFGGWDQYISALIAQKILTKEQRHSGEVDAILDRTTKRIRKACTNLDTANPERVASRHRVPEDFFDDDGGILELLPRPL